MRKLEKMIRNFVRRIDPEIRVVFHDDHMESDPINKTVFVNIDEFLFIWEDEQYHMAVLKEKGMYFDILLPIFMVLHEIGHIETIKKYSSPKSMLRKYINNCENIQGIKNINDLRKYKHLQLEKDADEYAYKFYLHNYNFVKKFDDEVRDIL